MKSARPLLWSAVFLLGVLSALTQIPRRSIRPLTPPLPAEINRITLETRHRSISLEKKQGRWKITSPIDALAHEGNLTAFLASVRALTLENVLTRRPESFGLYKLDDETGVRLRIWGAGVPSPQEWMIGKDSPSGGHVYVRFGSENSVYLAQGPSRAWAEADLTTWRDARVLPLAAEETVESLRLWRGPKEAFLKRTPQGWTLNDQPLSDEEAAETINNLRFLSADEFVDPPASQQILATAPDGLEQITVTLSGGRSHVLRVITRETKGPAPRLLLRRDEEPPLFWVPAHSFDLFPTLTKNASHGTKTEKS